MHLRVTPTLKYETAIENFKYGRSRWLFDVCYMLNKITYLLTYLLSSDFYALKIVRIVNIKLVFVETA